MTEPATTGETPRSAAGGAAASRAWIWLLPASFLLAYVALEWASDLHESRGVPITPWNPGLGLLFGAMVLFGIRYAAVLMLGYFIAEQIVSGGRLSAAWIVLIAVIFATSYGGAALLVRRWRGFDAGLERLRDIAILIGGGLAGTALACGLIALVLIGGRHASAADLPAPMLALAIGDAIGIAIFAPIVLRLARRLRRSPTVAALVPSAEMVVIAATILLLLSLLHVWLGAAAMRFIFVLFAPIVFAAVRHGVDGACLSLALTQFGLILILKATGQDARTFTEVQAEMLALTLTGLIVGVIVSERKALTASASRARDRLKALQSEADHAARITLAGGMSSVLAHEISQPITAARALARSAQTLMAQPAADLARAVRNIEQTVIQIDHAASIVHRMREFLRRGKPHVSTVDVEALLRTAISLASAAGTPAGIEIRMSVAEDLPQLFGDRTQLGQVLLNLIRNASEAILTGPGAGVIEVGAERSAQGELVFFVTDDGPGVSPSQIDGLFDPIQTTKPGGLGLGLAISAFIVQNHRGRIWLAASQPGRTEFRFSLPCDAGEGD